MLGPVGGAPASTPAQGWEGDSARAGARGSKLAVAAPLVFESPTELTTPPEVVRRRADRSLFSFSSRLPRKLVDILVIETTPVSRERVFSSVLLHWSRFYTPVDAARSREGCPRRARPITE